MTFEVVAPNELEFPPIEYGVTEAALAELRQKYAEPDASTDEGYEFCKDGVKELTALRTGIENRRKDLKQPALAWGREVDALAKKIVADIRAIEAPVRAAKDAVDEVKRVEAEAAVAAEQERIAGIRKKVSDIESLAREQAVGDTAADYAGRITFLKELDITEDVFAEFVDEAGTARDAALYKLEQWHGAAVAREAEEKRLEDQRREQEERQRRLDEQEAEQRAAQEKRDAEERQRRAEEKRKADEEAARETQRVGRMRHRIATLAALPDRAEGFGVTELEGLVAATQADELADVDDDFRGEAENMRDSVISLLNDMLDTAREREEAERADEEARQPDKVKLRRWCDAIADAVKARPNVSNSVAAKILSRSGNALDSVLTKLSNAIDRL